ncbi:DUF421 domain-containing protein [Paenibacillus sp. JX-17]|uniref:DUF421 domain-containing protein n=1 Tax=Paenibacillus lacisoli TaxID=3064525 RepID=A0ABT9CBT2_9BACL|nr:DUF421 domain-containing protein [Paenibacillus sp. JX-17]MDO7906719.1 DUF421 domain-containing protein [Paenibacillus sp. JX-17]
MTRFLGKKEISQLTPFDFVSSLVLSELVGNTIYQDDVHYPELLFALALWAVLSYLFEKITQHSRRLRGPLEGSPTLLIRQGMIDMKALKRQRLDMEQLRMMLRQKDIFAIREVNYAILETNGSLSVLKKPRYEPVAREDLKLEAPKSDYSLSLVEEGVIQEENLSKLGRDREWLFDELRKQGYDDWREPAYVEWEEDEGVFVLEHQENKGR